MSKHTFSSISSTELAAVAGGAGQSFDEYSNAQRQAVAPQYRQVVCTAAGVKGAPDLAKGMYGAGASDADKIRAADMLKGYCQGGASLPAQAPQSPF